MRKDPTEFRKRFAKWKEGGKPYKDGKISDEQYVSIMENVAADNWQQWGDESEDAALTRILNDNAYDYRGYYNDNPGSAANADTHWPDEYKTVWHPTFSTQSKYSGKKSQYNPYGYPGGTWQGELFNPQWYQQHQGTGFYKDGYPKLPKFEGGEEKFKLKKTPEYVQAGIDNQWSKVSNDDMGAAFQDIVVRPQSRGGNTTIGNWEKQWEPKYEKPLGLVSPEFDVLSLSQAASKIAKEIKRFKNWGGVELNYDRGNLMKFSYLDRNRNQLGHIDIRAYDGKPEISMINSNKRGVGRKLYDAAIEYVTDKNMPGIYSGKNLLSAPKTYSMWKHYPNKQLISVDGAHSNFRMPGVTGSLSKNMTKEQAMNNWSKNIFGGFDNGEVYLLKSPSSSVKYWKPYNIDITSITPLTNPIIGHTMSE